MPNYEATITGFATADDLEIRRTLDRSESNLASGVLIAKAWLTVKTAVDYTEGDDTTALFQKEITTTDVPGTGRIEDDGTGDTDPIVRFELVPADTQAIGTRKRYYDIQVLTDGGKIYTGEKGTIWAEAAVTIDDA